MTPTTNAEKLLLTIKETAYLLNCHSNTVYGLLHDGKIPAVTISPGKMAATKIKIREKGKRPRAKEIEALRGARYLIRRSDLDQYIAELPEITIGTKPGLCEKQEVKPKT